MSKNLFLFCISIFLCSASALAVNFSRINIAWQYDPNANIEVRSRAIQNEGQITIFYRIRTDTVTSWYYEFLLQDDYTSESHRELDAYKIDTLLDEVNQKIVSVTFSKKNENLMVLRISQPDVFYYHDTNLVNGNLPLASIYPVDASGLPIFEGYIKMSNHSWEGSSSYYAMQYKEDFVLADPPMADMKALAPSVDLDTAYVFAKDDDFLDNHFYVVREDSNSSSAITVLRESIYFPEFRKLDELLESMLYITNEPEKKALINSRNPKQSFDSFWMNTYDTKFRARNAIRNYYTWVKQANQLFTDFKQGWKTDRGMLFIVFGSPDEVYRTGSKEEWLYDQGPSFEFTIISTFFAPRTYALRRNLNLEETWYENIAAIRRGINE